LEKGEMQMLGSMLATDNGHIQGEDFFIRKNPDSIRLADLQIVEEFVALVLHFLSIWGQKRLLDDHKLSILNSSFTGFPSVLRSML
jgi:hypothetical protein